MQLPTERTATMTALVALGLGLVGLLMATVAPKQQLWTPSGVLQSTVWSAVPLGHAPQVVPVSAQGQPLPLQAIAEGPAEAPQAEDQASYTAVGWMVFPLMALAAAAGSAWQRLREPNVGLLAPIDLRSPSSNLGMETGRRGALLAAGLSAVVAASGRPPLAYAVGAANKTVGALLPPTGADGLYLFVPSKTETPSIRAGTINPEDPYSFALPGEWTRQPVSNAISGNYCQPKCGEPWTEVIFSGPEGRCQVVAGPLDKLTPKAKATLTDIGPPERVITSVGPYMTGTYIDEDSVISARVKKDASGNVYYLYEIYADYGTLPPHGLAAVTVKGDVILIFVVSATDRQWAAAQPQLRAVLESFQSDSAGRK